MGFYEDDNKLTFDEAESAVDRYIREHRSRRDTVTVKAVLVSQDIEQNQHNRIRVSEALKGRLDVEQECSPQRFIMPDEIRSSEDGGKSTNTVEPWEI